MAKKTINIVRKPKRDPDFSGASMAEAVQGQSSARRGWVGSMLYGAVYGVTYGVVFSGMAVGMLIPGKRIIGSAMVDATSAATGVFYRDGDRDAGVKRSASSNAASGETAGGSIGVANELLA